MVTDPRNSSVTTDHIVPSADQFEAFVAAIGDPDQPVVMLNLNRYRNQAVYADGRETDGASGHDAYLRYGVVAQQALEAVGARVVWATAASPPMIGCDHDRYDEVLAVWYPNHQAFVELTDFPGYADALVHRDAALEQAMIIPCAAGADGALTVGPVGV